MPKSSPQTVEAVYEGGVLKPLQPLNLPEHLRVRVTVNPPPSSIAQLLDYLHHPVELPLEEMVRASEIEVD